MAVKVYLTQNKNEDSRVYGKWFAMADNEKPIDLVGLARHMADHNTPFTEGTIVGILRDMVRCIRELNLSGQPVKIDNLAIFSAHLECRGGWTGIDAVDLSIGGQNDVIKAIRQCAQATGDFTKAELTKYGSVILNREWRQKVADAKKESGQDEVVETPTPTPSTGGGGDNPGDGD